MADNRMFLECTACGDRVMMAKTFGDGWYVQHRHFGDEPGDFTDYFSEWLGEHSWCPDQHDPNWAGLAYCHFRVRYEHHNDPSLGDFDTEGRRHE